MSFEAVAGAVRLRVANSSQKLILVLVSAFAGDDHVAWPAQATLAEQACMDVSTVGRALAGLEADKHIIRVARRRDNGSKTSDMIYLTIMGAAPLDGSDGSPEGYPPLPGNLPVSVGCLPNKLPGSDGEPKPHGAGAPPRNLPGPESTIKILEAGRPVEPLPNKLPGSLPPNLTELAKAIFEAAPLMAQQRVGLDPEKVRYALNEVVAAGADAVQVCDAMVGYYGTDDCQKQGGRFAAAPHTMIKDGRWRNWIARRPPHAVSLEAATAAGPSQVTWDGHTYAVPAGGFTGAGEIGTYEQPGIRRQVDWAAAWLDLGSWATSKMGPPPNEAGCRLWPSVYAKFGIPKPKGCAK